MEDDNKTYTILVVDDEENNLRFMEQVLKRDYIVRTALNGDEALDIISTDVPLDLILLDIRLPGINGYEVCAHLKKNEKTIKI